MGQRELHEWLLGRKHYSERCIYPAHVMMAYVGVEIQLHSFLTLTLNSQLQSLHVPPPPYALNIRLSASRKRASHFAEKMCPYREPNRDISCAHPVAQSLYQTVLTQFAYFTNCNLAEDNNRHCSGVTMCTVQTLQWCGYVHSTDSAMVWLCARYRQCSGVAKCTVQTETSMV